MLSVLSGFRHSLRGWPVLRDCHSFEDIQHIENKLVSMNICKFSLNPFPTLPLLINPTIKKYWACPASSWHPMPGSPCSMVTRKLARWAHISLRYSVFLGGPVPQYVFGTRTRDIVGWPSLCLSSVPHRHQLAWLQCKSCLAVVAVTCSRFDLFCLLYGNIAIQGTRWATLWFFQTEECRTWIHDMALGLFRDHFRASHISQSLGHLPPNNSSGLSSWWFE